MWIADGWKDYEVIDCSKGEKLERWGKYILLRPDPQVIWDTEKTAPQWKKLNGHYHRSSKGGGEWEFFHLPEQWSINYKELTFQLKPFSFKHTGLFPEQAVNWDWFSDLIQKADRPVKVLNLFAYTGGATISAAKAGASVTHVDASKGMVAWAKENAAASGLADAPIRYLVDDYGLSYYAAFAGCSAESEASFETVSFLAKKVDELGLPCVLTIEGKNHKLAETIVQSTAGKKQKVLTMDSMQSMTSKDAANGATYLSVMEQNLSVLKEALG